MDETKTEAYICLRCSREVVRPKSRGQKPKWCTTCRNGARPPFIGPRRPKGKGPIKRAEDAGDWVEVLRLLKSNSTVDENGCWIWKRGVDRAGYPVVGAGSGIRGHRLALMAYLGGTPLGSQPAHHICARSSCLNPEHLQLVTHLENVGEMMARQTYLARIRGLEEALRHLDPDHPMLKHAVVR